MASFWSLWVIVLTVVTLVGITWILFANRTRGEQPADRTTGHEYDGIEEYDNPLPAWWFYMFFITIVFGVGYLVLYPGMGNFAGVLDWTQEKQHDREVAKAETRYREMRDRYLALPVEEIAADPAVRKMGMRIFGNNCAQCHGSDGRGARGFPNLADANWQYGGDPETVLASIRNGRNGVMPAQAAVLGSDQAVDDMVEYVRSLSGLDHSEERAARAKVGS